MIHCGSWVHVTDGILCAQAAGVPGHLAYISQTLARGALQLRPVSTVRSVAWSPPGCTPAGGCLLAVVSEAYKVAAPMPAVAILDVPIVFVTRTTAL